MAIKNCPECGNEVSDSAMTCPKCGKVLRKPKRGFFGKIFLWGFYLYNLLMCVWLYSGFNAASDGAAKLTSDAEKVGAAIGTGIGITMILGIWVVGVIILGLLVLVTRPKA